MEIEAEAGKVEGGGDTSPGCSGYSGMVHSKKVIKHALRQQAKRRRKNTTIASGNSRTLPRIVVKPLPPPPPPNDPPSPPAPVQPHINAVEEPAATMREVLASLPGFSLKSGRRRSTKRLSAAAQLEAGLVDLETPASILASTSLRALLNRHTFQGLPPLYQRKLAQLLPGVDRQDAATSGLNNEFFARACLEWRKRLAEGEFTPENQQRLKMEAEKDKNKLDPWKLKHFEPIWGDKREPKLRLGLHCMPEARTGGAVTRSSLRLRLESSAEHIASELYCRTSSLSADKITSESEVVVDASGQQADASKDVDASVENGPEEEARVESLPEYDDRPRPSPEMDNRLDSTIDTEPKENNVAEVVSAISNGILVEYPSEDQHEQRRREEEDAEATPITAEPVLSTESKDQRQTSVNEESMQIEDEEEEAEEEEEDEEEEEEEEEGEEEGEEEEEVEEEEEEEEEEEDEEEEEEEEAPSESPTGHASTEEIMEIPEASIDEESNELLDQRATTVSEMQIECSSELCAEQITEISVALSHVDDSQVLQVVDKDDNGVVVESDDTKIFEISDCENAAAIESISEHVESEPEQLSDEHAAITRRIVEHGEAISTSAADPEPQIPECMEIDSETLQRIHELEVRGEMREAYEEISGCPEEIIYPILGAMEMGSSVSEETDPQIVPETVVEDVTEPPDVMNVVNVDDELRDANNYVCSEMLECSWPVDAAANSRVNNNDTNINNSPAQEDLQVPWPLVAAALDGTVAANITVTTQDECSDTPTTTDVSMSTTASSQQQQQFVNPEPSESLNCIQLPVVQTCSPFQSADSLTINAPSTPAAVSTCLMKAVQSPSPPIIAFPSLQSIRFVQTRFHPGQQNAAPALTTVTNSMPAQVQTQHNPQSHRVSIVRPSEEIVELATGQQHSNNVVVRTTVPNSIGVRGAVQASVVQATVGLPTQVHQQSAIVVQHQTPIVNAQSRQIVANMQTQQYTTATVPARTVRGNGQGTYRGSRSNNKEQGGRSRSSTKEPPGAVNLERSYQICQAVIQSSPNRDQLKAHLKPPPSLLARGDGAFTTSKSGGRTITTVKTQKHQQSPQHGKQTQNKTQAVMLRQVFATARQAAPVEVAEGNAVAQLSSNGTGGFGQYILVQRTGVSDGAPRASSAPPLPPQIAGIGVHLVRGRPASAGEGSHQAVTLKARGTSDGRGGGGAEPGAPGVIMGGDPPPPCECSMRGAMVICRQCGAFCHDDCIGPQRICATCLIR